MMTRSEIMRTVRSTNTDPEMIVRRLVHALGYRYRLHCRNLPGAPDLVLPRLRKAILVHGCFWHQHRCKRGSRQPATNRDYWLPKLVRNIERDRRNRQRLRLLGWEVMTVWECQTRHPHLEIRLRRFLEHT